MASSQSTVPVLIDRNWYNFPSESIIRIEGKGNYSQVHIVGGRVYLIAQTLQRYEESASDFWRINKGHLINPAFVAGSINQVRRTNRLSLRTGDMLPVSRRRRGEVCRLIRRLYSNP